MNSEAMKITDALTPGQRRTLIARVQHGTIKDAARALGISPDTIKGHSRVIAARLQVKNFVQAAVIAQREGLIQRSPQTQEPQQ